MIKLSLLLILLSCSSNKYLTSSQDAREALIDNDLVKAEKIALDTNFYKEDNTKLLKLLEQGSILHYSGKYFHSAKVLEEAKKLSDTLYTMSLSKRALGYIVNDNKDQYYSLKLEQSQIRFFLLMNYLTLSNRDFHLESKSEKNKIRYIKVIHDEKSKRDFLYKARATLLEWDSYLESFKDFSANKPTFKDDMSRLVYGSIVHKLVNTRADLEISSKLINQGQDILFKNYNLFEVFNSKASDFKKQYSELHKIPSSEVKKKYVIESDYHKDFTEFLDQLKKNNKYNTLITVYNGLISKKYAKTYDLTSSNVGIAAMAISNLSTVPNGMARITVPHINFVEIVYKYKLKLTRKEDNKVIYQNLCVLNPLSQIAYESHKELVENINFKTLSRYMTKKGIANTLQVIGTISTATKDSDAGIIFLTAGLLGHLYADTSEQPDLRYWSTLPGEIWSTSLELEPGNYITELETHNYQGLVSTNPLGDIVINEAPLAVYNFKI